MKHIALVEAVLNLPTAPFHEQAVARFIRRFAADRRLRLREDDAGNLRLGYDGGGRRRAWCFAAHMDHPGFRVRRTRGRHIFADFLGGVEPDYFPGAKVRFLPPDGPPVRATVKNATRDPQARRLKIHCEANTLAGLPPDTPGMWDLPPFRMRRDGTLESRACDDLAGVAAILCLFDELIRQRSPARVHGLFTRAEEIGFAGAAAACSSGIIPRGAVLVGLETSAAQPAAPLGGGCVIRVGDRSSVFDPAITNLLSAVAADLQTRQPTFAFRRALMPGGTCESTAYQALGHPAGALCVPLGNYHNRGAGNRIRPECIDRRDFENLVALLAACATTSRTRASVSTDQRRRVRGLLAFWKKDLLAPRTTSTTASE